MRETGKGQKPDRLLEIFFLAMKGEGLSVKELSDRYSVSSRSITRDIAEIKAFLSEHREMVNNAELEYSSVTHRYYLKMDSFLTNRELLGLTKILIGSRSIGTEEIVGIISKLKQHTSHNDREKLDNLIRKEVYHYSPVHSDCESVLDNLWTITENIEQHKAITITYYKMDRKQVVHKVKPMSILFSEYYFYLVAYEYGNDEFPNYFRLDRIVKIVVNRETFEVPKGQSVDEGLIRHYSQFMWYGKVRNIRFSFSGPSVQAILDRIPSARIVEVQDGKYIIDAQVQGNGIKMFLLSQGAWVEVLSPKEFREEMKEEIRLMADRYSN